MFAITEASQQALNNLRSTGNFQWYLVPLLAFVVYAYAVEVERKNWNVVLAGAFFFSLTIAGEMWNGLVLHVTDTAALWTALGDSAFTIFVGLTIEIAMMFSVAGIILTKVLPENKRTRIWGIPNRILIPVAFALFCVFVEVILNQWGVLVWEYAWWRWPNIWLLLLLYSFGFLAITWFFDLKSMKAKVWIVAGVYAFDIVAFIRRPTSRQPASSAARSSRYRPPHLPRRGSSAPEPVLVQRAGVRETPVGRVGR